MSDEYTAPGLTDYSPSFQILNLELYQLFFNNTRDAIFINEYYSDGWISDFIEVNTLACHLLGYNKTELLKMSLHDIDIKLRTDTIDSRLPEKDHVICQSQFINKCGMIIPVEITTRSFKTNDRTFMISMVRDISDRQKLVDEILKLDRLNIIAEMAASIGHEVRNPLTSIRGFLQLMSAKTDNTANQQYFQLMIEELDRANTIITEFLTLSKTAATNLKLVNLNNIIYSIYPLLQADALSNNRQICLALNNIPEIWLDEKKIRQLIINLARNGLEAMDSGKTVTIRTFVDQDDVILAVQDEGYGIPKEVLPKLGTPFFTTKENGSGIGLLVCYNIAEEHNATITPLSSPQGSTFLVRFKQINKAELAPPHSC